MSGESVSRWSWWRLSRSWRPTSSTRWRCSASCLGFFSQVRLSSRMNCNYLVNANKYKNIQLVNTLLGGFHPLLDLVQLFLVDQGAQNSGPKSEIGERPGLFRIRPFPAVWELDYLSGLGHGLKGLQAVPDDPALAQPVFGFAEHASPGELHDQSPRRPGILHAIRTVAHGQGRDAGGLHHPLNQTHGLMAFRSDRHRKQGGHSLFPETLYQKRGAFLDQGHHVVDIAEAVIGGGQ